MIRIAAAAPTRSVTPESAISGVLGLRPRSASFTTSSTACFGSFKGSATVVPYPSRWLATHVVAVGSGHGDRGPRAALLHGRRRSRRAHRARPARAPHRLRARPAGVGAQGVLRAARAQAATRQTRRRGDRPLRPERARGRLSPQTGPAPLPGLDGAARAGALRDARRLVRRDAPDDLAPVALQPCPARKASAPPPLTQHARAE